MKKSNVAAFVAALVISAFLLWLWFHLGFNRIDAPLDLALSIIWWLLVLVASVVIWRVEKKRQERVRTCYIADKMVYNSEAGAMAACDTEEAVERIYDIIDELEYGFGIEDCPENVSFNYVVRSAVFNTKREAGKESDMNEELDWRGEVAVVERPDDDPIPFNGRDDLLGVLKRQAARSAA